MAEALNGAGSSDTISGNGGNDTILGSDEAELIMGGPELTDRTGLPAFLGSDDDKIQGRGGDVTMI